MLRRGWLAALGWLACNLVAAAPPAALPDLQVGDLGLEAMQEALFGLCAARQPERAEVLRKQLLSWREQQADPLRRLEAQLRAIELRQLSLIDAGQVLPAGATPADLLAARMQSLHLVLGTLGLMPDAQVREHCQTLPARMLEAQHVQNALAAAQRFQARLPMPPVVAPNLVIFVRHAEKSSEAGNDPALSEAGQRRAHQLAAALADAGVQHIISTQWRRTRDTAEPLATQLGLQTQVLATQRGVSHAQEVATRVRSLKGTVLVVGHGNTVPEILAALGGPQLPWLCESSYGHILLWRPAERSLLRLRYGQADPAPAADCL